ncbi:hypothetical protein M407DRAFT_30549 [Tulasnella calospora MUT 4182]|uniref:Peptidase A1 domain-containing protein n=1 Tax=Tulasnella calospora MUT 4182 TaxID=1051891 RepID=A0A0C3LEC5_9AGAM|nr:hypothetical protein M407DRAFT_30549 [Tulasnella calospora MUT 4182]
MFTTSIVTQTVAALLAVSTSSFASPAPEPLKNTLIAPFVNSPAAMRRSEDYNPLRAIERDISKLEGKQGPARGAVRERRQGSATCSLKNEGNINYPSDILVGTPGQRITGVIFDTGSSDLTVPWKECAICQGSFYSPEQLSTFKSLRQSFKALYGLDHAEVGAVVSDTVSLGDLSVRDQVFGVITNASSSSTDQPEVATMGLGFPANSATGGIPWFTNLVNEGSLASNVFYLTHSEAKGSELCVGCIDSSKFIGQPEYFPVVSINEIVRWWAIQSAGIFHDNAAITAMIDSGHTGIALSDANTAAFYAQIPGAVPNPPTNI